jgi:glycosyltransferase involved in cell wall biosynthesis
VQTVDGNQDGIPVALMEAMALGLPVITTRVSGIPELVVDGVSGLLVAPGDAGALAEAIERLLKDPALREVLSRQGSGAVRARHDISCSVVQMQEVFSEALDAA